MNEISLEAIGQAQLAFHAAEKRALQREKPLTCRGAGPVDQSRAEAHRRGGEAAPAAVAGLAPGAAQGARDRADPIDLPLEARHP